MMFASFLLWFFMGLSVMAPDCSAGYMIDVETCPTDAVFERNSRLTIMAIGDNTRGF